MQEAVLRTQNSVYSVKVLHTHPSTPISTLRHPCSIRMSHFLDCILDVPLNGIQATITFPPKYICLSYVVVYICVFRRQGWCVIRKHRCWCIFVSRGLIRCGDFVFPQLPQNTNDSCFSMACCLFRFTQQRSTPLACLICSSWSWNDQIGLC